VRDPGSGCGVAGLPRRSRDWGPYKFQRKAPWGPDIAKPGVKTEPAIAGARSKDGRVANPEPDMAKLDGEIAKGYLENVDRGRPGR